MQQPITTQCEPWTNFPNLSYCFLNDNFLHKSRAVFKFTLKGERGGVEIKQIIKNASNVDYLHDQTKLWFSLPGNRSLSAKLKTGQQIKVHFDNGNTDMFGKSINLYAAFNFSRQLNNIKWRFGLAHLGELCHSDTRIMFGSHDQPNPSLCNRTLITQGRFKYGLAASYDLRNHILTKNNLLLGCDIDSKTSVFIRAQNDKFRSRQIKFGHWKSYFDHILIDLINKYDTKTQVGFEFDFQTHGKPFKEATVVLERQFSEGYTSKLQLTTNFQANLLLSGPAFFNKDQCTISLGLHAANLNRQHKIFQYGGQLQFAF